MMPQPGDIWKFSKYHEDTFLIISDHNANIGDNFKAFNCFCFYTGKIEVIGFPPSMDRWARLA